MASDEHSKDDAPATATIAVHGVEDAQQSFGAVVSPVFHSSTYGFTGEQLHAASNRGGADACPRLLCSSPSGMDTITELSCRYPLLPGYCQSLLTELNKYL